MKKLLILLLLFTLPLWAAQEDMSIVVMQAKDGKILHAQHAHLPMMPASTTKLLTAYVALQQLGPDFSFKTQVLKSGNDVYIKFSGDPSLTTADLKQLLTQANLKQPIQGKIFIDATAFANPSVARGWSAEDLYWYFAAPVHSVILNENNFSLNLVPAQKLGETLKIQAVDPKVKVISTVKAVSPEKADSLCQLDVSLPAPYQIELDGCWPLDNQPQTLRVANAFPLETAEVEIRAMINYQGKMGTALTPGSAQVLAEHQSPPLSTLIKSVLQDSNNIYTEALTKTLGQLAYELPTFQAGSHFIELHLEKSLGIPPGEIIIFDGSGLSSLDLISAQALAQVLQAAYSDPKIRDNFLAALTTSGVNGSLKNRLTGLNPPFVGKTGGMTHVSTLAGYHDLDGDNPLIYVIMLNHGSEKLPSLRQEVDNTLMQLIRSYFTNTSATGKLRIYSSKI